MNALEQQLDRLLVLTAEAEPDREAFRACLGEVTEAAREVTREEREAGLQRMAVALGHANPHIGGYIAITGGVWVETGTSAQFWFDAMLPHLADALQAAAQFVDACEAALPPENAEEETEEILEEEYDAEAEDDEDFEDEEEYSEEDEEGYEEDEEEGEEEGGLWLGDRLVPEEIAVAAIKDHQKGYQAYEALELWCLPAIACLSRSEELRALARQQPQLLELATHLARYNGQAEFLRKMLLVLDNETLLVLHPETRKGFRCRIGGIADNFQLHILLADALITSPRSGGMLGRLFGRKNDDAEEGLSGTRPHPVIISVAKGEGAQTASIQSAGNWNVYQWTACKGTGQLPTSTDSSEHWVWNEGIPADILSFDGTRVILLGPPAYQRNWNTARLFEAMSAYVRVEERLTSVEVEDWLRRFAWNPGK